VYLTVLYTEFVPVICERFIGRVKLPGRFARLNDLAEQAMRFADYLLGRCLILFIILGVTVSCLHQSSLGMLLVIAPYKLHPLYWSRFLPLFFLTSAIAVGFPTIIFSMMAAAKVFNREPPMHILTPLARYVPYFMGVYVALKLGDMLWRGSYRFLFEGTVSCIVFWADFVLLTLVPFFLFMSSEIRRSQVGLFTAATMFVVGIVLNRCTIFFIAYEPLYAEKVYIPAVAETALAIGFIATMLFLYRAAVTFFPILLAPVKKAGQAAHS
jgi:Ni/Fe-hydrogenase subunit HybB-like protein